MRVITQSSVWVFDEDSKIFSRFPKNEGITTDIPYSRIGKPSPYVEIERGFWMGADRIRVRAVDVKQSCYTGMILEVIE